MDNELDHLQVSQRYISGMGEELGKLYKSLMDEFTWLVIKWHEYVDLFGTKPSRVNLLNRTAPLFFKVVHDTLLENVILGITRITDPEKTGKKANITIQALPSAITDEKLQSIVSDSIKNSLEKCSFCRDWRNRKIAHSDYSLALDRGAVPLESASRAKLKEALKSIAELLNILEGFYMDSEIIFDLTPHRTGAVSLLYCISDGLRSNRRL